MAFAAAMTCLLQERAYDDKKMLEQRADTLPFVSCLSQQFLDDVKLVSCLSCLLVSAPRGGWYNSMCVNPHDSAQGFQPAPTLRWEWGGGQGSEQGPSGNSHPPSPLLIPDKTVNMSSHVSGLPALG